MGIARIKRRDLSWVTILVCKPKYFGRTNIFRHQEPTISIPVKIVFGGGKFFSNSAAPSHRFYAASEQELLINCS
jgi:hypothetical protein